MVKPTWHTCLVIGIQGGHEGLDIEANLLGKLWQCLGHRAFKDGRHETANGFGVRNGVTNLTWLLRNQSAPNGVTLGPKVFAFVVKALCVFVHHNAQSDAIDAGTNTAVVKRRARVNGNHVSLRWIADLIGAGVQHVLEQSPLIEFGAPN